MDDVNTDTGPAKAVSQLGESLASTADSHRALIQEIAVFTKDETMRFANLRLERNGQALDKLSNCQGLSGLVSVQQEWLRDLMKDYADQNMRFANAFRGLAHNMMASATEAATDNLDRMQKQAVELAQQADTVAEHAQAQAGAMAQDTANGQSYAETQH